MDHVEHACRRGVDGRAVGRHGDRADGVGTGRQAGRDDVSDRHPATRSGARRQRGQRLPAATDSLRFQPGAGN